MPLHPESDITAYATFPDTRWEKIRSTNPLERLNREVKRRADVVQVFPNSAALQCLTSAVLAKLHDEWRPPLPIGRLHGRASRHRHQIHRIGRAPTQPKRPPEPRTEPSRFDPPVPGARSLPLPDMQAAVA
ncbi:hypothetical protein ABH935_009279 [Catenulispora sp. GAS73]